MHSGPDGAGQIDSAKVEEIVLSLTAERLGRLVEQVDSSASLIDLGLSSIDAVLLCGEIEERLLIAVDPISVFECESLSDFIAIIRDAVATRQADIG